MSSVILNGAPATDKEKILADFRNREEAVQWKTVNDDVMGGKSFSRTEILPEGMRFSGNVSLKNNGGFSSVRRKLNTADFSGYDGVILTVKGDGKTYGISFSDWPYFTGLYHNARFVTATNQAQQIKVPFAALQPLYYGRYKLGIKPLNLNGVEEMSVIISDKQEGEFSLMIEKIEFYKESETVKK